MDSDLKKVDPVKIVEYLNYLTGKEYEGDLTLKFKKGEIINVYEDYDENIPMIRDLIEDDIEELEKDEKRKIIGDAKARQRDESIKHFEGLLKWKLYGKMTCSAFNGEVRKFNVRRSIPMEKFWLEKK